MALARLLGFAFALVVAGNFSPSDYGAIQYAITLAMVIAIGTQPLGQHVLARFIGKLKDDPHELRRYVASVWVLLAAVFGLTLLIALPTLAITGKLNAGIPVILMGVTLFYAYWGLARGFLAPHKLTAAYLGSNAVQLLLVLILLRSLGLHSTLLVLLIYGLSYIVPLGLLQWRWPLPAALQFSLADRGVVRELARFSRPIWLSHACFMLFSAIDVLLLERLAGTASVGVYSVAKTLGAVLLFVPVGVSTLLVPKAANLPRREQRQLLKRTLAWSLLISGGVLALYLLLARPLVRAMFGPDYVAASGTYLALGLAMVLLGADNIVTAIVVGAGNPGFETASRVVALLAAAVVGWLCIPAFGTTGAALAMLAGSATGMVVFGVLIARRWSA
jgi:O-antigen/teichoic acid export membrane protein